MEVNLQISKLHTVINLQFAVQINSASQTGCSSGNRASVCDRLSAVYIQRAAAAVFHCIVIVPQHRSARDPQSAGIFDQRRLRLHCRSRRPLISALPGAVSVDHHGPQCQVSVFCDLKQRVYIAFPVETGQLRCRIRLAVAHDLRFLVKLYGSVTSRVP